MANALVQISISHLLLLHLSPSLPLSLFPLLIPPSLLSLPSPLPPPCSVVSLMMSPISDSFLSGSLDRTIRLWDLRSQNCQGLMHLNGRPVASYDPEGLIFAAGIDSRQLKLYDLRTFDKVTCFLCWVQWNLIFPPLPPSPSVPPSLPLPLRDPLPHSMCGKITAILSGRE